jgi:copper chaperone
MANVRREINLKARSGKLSLQKKLFEMQTHRYKTTIKCGGCVAVVKPVLDQNPNISSWEVDLNHPERILTVHTDLGAAAVQKLVTEAGYKADPV